MSTRIKRISLVLLIGLSLFGACESPETRPQIALKQNESVQIADLLIRVDAIQDSRCPINASCSRAGEALADLSITQFTEMGIQKRRLHIRESISVQFGLSTYNILLKDVTPYADYFEPDKREAIIQVIKL